MKNNKVSIIIPVYNGSNYLKNTIDSALNQTYKNIEIIVVNDGSTDNGETEKIALSYGDKIKYYNKKNGGVSTALNYGIKHMTGEYFSWLSHDDLYYPTKIEEEIKMLEKEENKDIIVFSDYEYIDENNKLLEKINISEKLISTNYKYVFYKRMISGISLLIPKKILIKEGLFDTKLKCTQDYDLWFKLINKYEFKYLNKIVVSTRLHKGQDSNVKDYIVDESEKLWNKIIKETNKKTIEEIFCNEYNFYLEMYNTLKYSNYENIKKDLREILYNQFIDNMVDEITLNRFNSIKNPNIINEIKKELSNKTKIISALKKELENCYNSISWKITKPLRIASSFIRNKQK